MKKLKITAALLSVAVCAGTLSACTPKMPTTVTTTTENNAVTVPAHTAQNHQLSLPYSKSDSLNPFKSVTLLNQQLLTLMYDGLYKLDEKLTPTPVLASSGAVSGKNVTVTLRGNVKFRDGSYVTAADVVASFTRAKASPRYSSQLKNFKSCRTQSDGSLLFVMEKENPNALACLDFAVVSSASSDNDRPTGTGRYYAVKNSSEIYLQNNKNCVSAQKLNLQKITLTNISDSSALPHSMEIGNIDYFFTDLNSGSYQRINGATQEFVMNNLVYLGIQSKNKTLQNPLVLQAIGKAIERSAIVTNAYQGHAVAAVTPFRPDWNKLSGVKLPENKTDITGAVKLLEQAGFNKELTGGTRHNGRQSLMFKLIVNKENSFRTSAARLIAHQLKQIGVSVSVTVLPFGDYIKAVQSGDFDLYLGEMKLLNDMSLSAFFEKDGAAHFGVPIEGATAAAYNQYLVSAVTLQSFLDAFNKHPAFYPLCYRKGVSASSRIIKTGVRSHSNDLFSNINEWSF